MAEFNDDGVQMDVEAWKQRCETLKKMIKLLEEDRDTWHKESLKHQTALAALRDKNNDEKEFWYRACIKSQEQHLAYLEKENGKRDAEIKKALEAEIRFKTSRQTLYCDWDDYSTFSVPEGVDLKDTKNVKWYVRWNTLHIETKDGKTYELEATDAPQLKRPETCRVVDRDGDEEEEIEFNSEFQSDSEDEEATDD